MERIDTVWLTSGSSADGETLERIDVRGPSGELLLPDFALPFWRTQFEGGGDTPAVLLEPDLHACREDDERLQLINAFLRGKGVFRERALPDPKGDSP